MAKKDPIQYKGFTINYLRGEYRADAYASPQFTNTNLAKLKKEINQYLRDESKGGSTYAKGGKADNIFVNVLLDYDFIETRGHYSIRNFQHNSNGYFAFIDMKNRNVEVFKDAIEGTNYSGFSIRGLIDFLNKNGFTSGNKFAKGGFTYAEGGEISDAKLKRIIANTAAAKELLELYNSKETKKDGLFYVSRTQLINIETGETNYGKSRKYLSTETVENLVREAKSKGFRVDESHIGFNIVHESNGYTVVMEYQLRELLKKGGSTYAEGGSIKSKWFSGELSFLNW